MPSTPADELRKLEFRELARDIVKIDREKRKFGKSINTTGTIARAMEKAYQRGRKEEREGQPDIPPQDGDACINWYLIPPRPRGAFWTICLCLLGSKPPFQMANGGLELITERRGERFRWAFKEDLEDEEIADQMETWGARTIHPLTKLHLLTNTSEHQLVLTPKGLITWRTALTHVNFNAMCLAG